MEALTSVSSALSGYILLIVLVIVLVAFGKSTGRGTFVALIGSLYTGYALYSAFPYISSLPSSPPLTSFGAGLAVFALFTVGTFLMFYRVMSDYNVFGVIGLLILSILTAALIVAILYHTLSLGKVYSAAPSLIALFDSAKYFFWWLVAPLVGLVIFA